MHQHYLQLNNAVVQRIQRKIKEFFPPKATLRTARLSTEGIAAGSMESSGKLKSQRVASARIINRIN